MLTKEKTEQVNPTENFIPELSNGLWLSLVMLLSLLLRFFRLDQPDLWLDETYQFYYSRLPASDIMAHNNPDQLPLSFYLNNFFLSFTTHIDAGSLRLPSAWLGLGIVLACYGLGQELFNKKVGLMAAFLASFWPMLLLYSQEYRMYALFGLLSTCSALYLLKALRTGSPWYWAVFSLATVLNLYNHFNALIVLASSLTFGGLYLVLAQPHRSEALSGKPAKSWYYPSISLGVILVAYLPGIFFLLKFLDTSNGGLEKAYFAPDLTFSLFSDMLDKMGLGGGLAALLIFGLALLGFIWAFGQFPRAAAFAFVWLGLPFLSIAALEKAHAVLLSWRYLIFLVPVYIVLVAAGTVAMLPGLTRLISGLRFLPPALGNYLTRNPGQVAALLLFLISLPAVIGYYANPKAYDRYSIDTDLSGAFEYLKASLEPTDVVLAYSSNNIAAGDVSWFQFYFPYYLRDVPASVTRLIPIPQNQAEHYVPALSSSGRLWTIINYNGNPGELEKIGGAFAETRCFRKICVIRSPDAPGLNMANKLENFLTSYREINPELSRFTLDALKRARAVG